MRMILGKFCDNFCIILCMLFLSTKTTDNIRRHLPVCVNKKYKFNFLIKNVFSIENPLGLLEGQVIVKSDVWRSQLISCDLACVVAGWISGHVAHAWQSFHLSRTCTVTSASHTCFSNHLMTSLCLCSVLTVTRPHCHIVFRWSPMNNTTTVL
uniref:Secreted protein n=1 Tax=Cacopsylla melanoneura TaxID=428564 RepID=A0A8D9F8J6_9HEMI